MAVNTIDEGLVAFERQMQDTVYRALQAASDQIQARMQATDVYQNVSGATRAGSVAYALSPDGTADLAPFRDAASQVVARRPGEGVTYALPNPPDNVGMVVVTVPTRYQIHLETSHGGRRSVISVAVMDDADTTMQSVVRHLRAWFA